MAWVRAGVATGVTDMWARGADVEKPEKGSRARARARTRDASVRAVVADHWARRSVLSGSGAEGF